MRSIDLFAGIGGIRLGFEMAFGESLETVFVSEWDKYAVQTYKTNFHDPFEVAGDITQYIIGMILLLICLLTPALNVDQHPATSI